MTITDAQFAQWCRTARKVCVLVELDYMYQVGVGEDAVPTKGTIYLSNLGYIDEDASPPRAYDPVLLSVPRPERILDTETLRGAAKVTLSEPARINNADKRYDFLLALALDGSEFRVSVGDPAWPITDFRHAWTALNAKAEASKQQQIEVTLADIGLLLNKSIGGTVAVGGTGPNANAFRPLPFGYVHNMEPVLVDPLTFTYAYADRSTNASVPVVRANGVVLASGTDYTDSGGVFALTSNPQSDQITCDPLLYAPGKTATDYRISDAIEFFVGGEAGLTALGKYAGAHATYFLGATSDSGLNDYHCGKLLPDKTNVIGLLDELMSTANGFWAPNRFNEFQFGRMRPEALSAIVGLSGGTLGVSASITAGDIVRDSIGITKATPKYATYQCLANANQTKQTTFAGTLNADDRAMLSRDGLPSAAFLGEEPDSTAYIGSSQTWLGGAPQRYNLSMSDSQVIPTLISGASDTDVPDPATGFSVADYQAGFNSIRRSQFLPWLEFVNFTTFLEFLALEIGDVVNLTYPRFDLDGGELHQVYRIAIDAMKARVELGVTRRRFATVTGVVPPFDFLLQENGDYLLLEDGGRIIINTGGGGDFTLRDDDGEALQTDDGLTLTTD